MLVVEEQEIFHLLLELLELVVQILAEMVELLHRILALMQMFIQDLVAAVERETPPVTVSVEVLVRLVLLLLEQYLAQMQT
jgi:hypothetical protein